MRKIALALFFLVALIITTKLLAQTSKPVIELQSGHSNPVNYVGYSHDGKFILSCSSDYSLMLWFAETGKKVRTFHGHKSSIRYAVFSKDGKSIISCSSLNDIIIWDILTGNIIKSYDGQDEKNSCITVSPDQKYYISALAKDNTIEVRNLEDGKTVTNLVGHKEQIYCLTFAPDGNTFFSGSDDGTIKQWDITTAKQINSFSNNYGEVYAIAISPDGNTLVCGVILPSYSYSLSLCDIASGKEIKILDNDPYRIRSLTFSSDGKTILSGANIVKDVRIDIIRLFDVESGKMIRSFEGHTDDVNSVAFSPDGKKIISGSRDKSIKLWDISSGTLESTLGGFGDEIRSIAISPNQKFLVSGGWDNIIKVWDTESGKLLRSFPGHPDGLDCLTFSPDGKLLLASITIDNMMKMWYFETGKEIKTFTGNRSYVNSIDFSPDNETIVSCNGDSNIGEIKLWNRYSGGLIRNISGHASDVKSVAFSPDGTKFISGSNDKTIKLWMVNNGMLLKTFVGNTEWVSVVAFSPDGKKIVSGGGDGIIMLWDVETGSSLKTIAGHKGYINSIVFSPNGNTFFSSGKDAIIKMWDAATGKEVKTFIGHNDEISSMKILANGTTIISCSIDNTIKFWKVATGELISTSLSNPDGSQWLTYNKDGYWDASPNGGNLVAMVYGLNVWNIDQFAVRNNRPDIIWKNSPNTNPELIKHYYSLYQKRLKRLNITEDKVSKDYEIPETKITKTTIDGKNATIDFTITSKTSKVTRFSIFVNDVPIFGAYGKEITNIGNGDLNSQPLSEIVELTNGDNKIEISAMNENGAESFRALTLAKYKPLKPIKPDLYYIGFGVSKYAREELNLQYADKDAKDIACVFEKMKSSGQFANVYSKTLLNEEVTPASIKAAKDFVKNAKPDDTFILFIAGHGTHDTDKDATYYYLTSNADPNNLTGTAADFETIEDLLQGIPPRNKLFLMDACESGEIDDEDQGLMIAAATGAGISSRGFKKTVAEIITAPSSANSEVKIAPKRSYLYQKDRYIYNDLVRRSGAIVYSSSKGGELSYERSDIQNGLFTKSIINALTSTAADKNNDGIVSTDELREYVSAEVGKSSNDLQHPTVDRDNIYQKFGFKIVR